MTFFRKNYKKRKVWSKCELNLGIRNREIPVPMPKASEQTVLDKGKRLKKKFLISNDLIVATISLQTKLTRMSEHEARSYILDRTVDGREGFFCLTSNLYMGLVVIIQKYRDKDCVEKLFPSMKSDIGIRPIRA